MRPDPKSLYKEIEDKIKTILQSPYGDREDFQHMDLVEDLDLGEIEILYLVAALEEVYGVKLRGDSLEGVRTVRDLTNSVGNMKLNVLAEG